MSFSSKLNKETPQSLWSEQQSLGARLMTTIPFGSKVENMSGFISVMGSAKEGSEFLLPVLTICVEKPSGGAIASTIVFPSQETYFKFIDSIHLDAYTCFEASNDFGIS